MKTSDIIPEMLNVNMEIADVGIDEGWNTEGDRMARMFFDYEFPAGQPRPGEYVLDFPFGDIYVCMELEL